MGKVSFLVPAPRFTLPSDSQCLLARNGLNMNLEYGVGSR